MGLIIVAPMPCPSTGTAVVQSFSDRRCIRGTDTALVRLLLLWLAAQHLGRRESQKNAGRRYPRAPFPTDGGPLARFVDFFALIMLTATGAAQAMTASLTSISESGDA